MDTGNQDANPGLGVDITVEPSRRDAELCHRCTAIDLSDAFKDVINLNGRYIMPLGEVTKQMRFASCPLCRLFAHVHTPLNLHHLTVPTIPKTTDITCAHSMGLPRILSIKEDDQRFPPIPQPF
jgi:hypothetical protein